MIGGANQFKDSSIEQILKSISDIGGNLLTPTVSICPVCVYHIPAYKYHKDGAVYMCKHCLFHGTSHHKIENDYEFYAKYDGYHLSSTHNFNDIVHIEGSDRCQLDCPHCYHLPDSRIQDVPREQLIDQIKNLPLNLADVQHLILAGAESSLRADFVELVADIKAMGFVPGILTNGIRFGDPDFLKRSLDAGLGVINVGLNHPDYNNYEKVRLKQVNAIEMLSNSDAIIGYISYTMVDLSELDYILTEITTSKWNAYTYRIRGGSEIGRNGTEGRPYLSDIWKAVKEWCSKNNKSFEPIPTADDNLYHVMAMVDGKEIRLIQWCDITDIDMENLRCGPWNNFIPGPVTNFLHQVIVRDEWKNKGKILPDVVPERYRFAREPIDEPLDFSKL